MTFIKSNLILASMFFALAGATMVVSATCVDADSKYGTGHMSVSAAETSSIR